jgi:hypothetical protein
VDGRCAVHGPTLPIVATSRTQAYSFPSPPQIVFGIAFTTLNSSFGNVAQISPTTLRAKAKISVLSWGEEVTLDVQPAPIGSAVTVTSRSTAGLQVVDWGVHRKNIDTVFNSLAQALSAAAAGWPGGA